MNSRAPANPTMTVGPRPGPDVIKSTAALLQTASQRPSVMITSSSSVQVSSILITVEIKYILFNFQNTEKHLIKTVAGSGAAPVSSSINNPGSSQTRPANNSIGSVQIAARTIPQVGAVPLTCASSLITANSGKIRRKFSISKGLIGNLMGRSDPCCFHWWFKEYYTSFNRCSCWEGSLYHTY